MPPPRTFGEFRLVKQLGAGAQAEIWLVESERHPRDLRVVKIAAPGMAGGSNRSRFLHEARVAQTIEHPNVVRILDAGESDDRLYLVMEYIDGRSWRQVINDLAGERAYISVDAVLEMVSQALDGLQALHEAVDADGQPVDVVHRDLAPKNLMLDRTGQTKIIDLGIARSALRDQRTRTGVMLGTPGYMAPEQVRGGRVDARSDVFAMGAVLFEMLTLERLIEGTTLVERLAKSEAAFRPASSIRPDLDDRLDEIIRCAVDPDPRRRFSSAAAFARELTTLQTEDVYSTGIMDTVAHELVCTKISGADPTAVLSPRPPAVETSRHRPGEASARVRAAAATTAPRPRAVEVIAAPPSAFPQPQAEPVDIRRGPSLLGPRNLLVAMAFGAVASVAAWGTERAFRGEPAPLVDDRGQAGPRVAPAPQPAAATPAPQAGPPATESTAAAPSAFRAGSASADSAAAVRPAAVPNPAPVRTARRRLPAKPRPSPRGEASKVAEKSPNANATAVLDDLIQRTRRLASNAPSDSLQQKAFDLMIRLNRLSAEARRGEPTDLAAARSAVESLEQKTR